MVWGIPVLSDCKVRKPLPKATISMVLPLATATISKTEKSPSFTNLRTQYALNSGAPWSFGLCSFPFIFACGNHGFALGSTKKCQTTKAFTRDSKVQCQTNELQHQAALTKTNPYCRPAATISI